MKDLIEEYLPNAPKIGLYVTPNIPSNKVRNAVGDYARQVDAAEVLALYDATLMGSGKDGAVFLADRFVYQNNDLEPPQMIRYDDIVRVSSKRKLLGGREINLDANSGSATVTHTLDFSGRPDAAEYVLRFLNEAMLRLAARSPGGQKDEPGASTGAGTNIPVVRRALDTLRREGHLADEDFEALINRLNTL